MKSIYLHLEETSFFFLLSKATSINSLNREIKSSLRESLIVISSLFFALRENFVFIFPRKFIDTTFKSAYCHLPFCLNLLALIRERDRPVVSIFFRY